MHPFIIKYLLTFLDILFQLCFWAIFIQVLLSWFSRGGRTPLGTMLDQIVRPIVRPFRWARVGMFDFSPLLALIMLSILMDVMKELIVRLA